MIGKINEQRRQDAEERKASLDYLAHKIAAALSGRG